MFRIIYLRGGMCSALYTENLNLVGIFVGRFIPYYIPEGGCVPYFIPDRRFYSGQPILHFVIVTYDFIYLINLIG